MIGGNHRKGNVDDNAMGFDLTRDSEDWIAVHYDRLLVRIMVACRLIIEGAHCKSYFMPSFFLIDGNHRKGNVDDNAMGFNLTRDSEDWIMAHYDRLLVRIMVGLLLKVHFVSPTSCQLFAFCFLYI